MRSSFAKILLSIATIILVAHNLIPHHHHHESEIEIAGHHHHQETDSHAEGAMDLNDIFSHFIHSNDGYITLTRSQTDIKSFIHFTTVIYEDIYINKLNKPPLQYISPPNHLLNTSRYFFSSGLRAPPVC